MKAVLWDLDGTIADTGDLHFQAWREIMPRYGVDFTHSMFLHSFGRNNTEILGELLPDPSSDKIRSVSKDKERAFRVLITPEKMPMLPGVADWLERFRSMGLRQAIGSSGPMANIVAVVNALDAGDYFHALLSGYALPRGKPDPMLFLLCAAAVGAEPRECLVMEDSIHGIEAAWRAGIPSVAVGRLASAKELLAYTAAGKGPPCIGTPTLADLHESQLTTLF